ncbi:MAG: hypothetical protein P8X95_28000, partial [Anaerolineales bacterium]
QERTAGSLEVALLSEAYTQVAARLGEMIQAEGHLEKRTEGDRWNEDFLDLLVRLYKYHGIETDKETVRESVLARCSKTGSGARRVTEEVAGVRLMLRRVFCLAMETEDVRERVKLAGIYGSGCHRLVRLLKGRGNDQEVLYAYLNQLLDDAIGELTIELELE